jgi:hypothetical protein
MLLLPARVGGPDLGPGSVFTGGGPALCKSEQFGTVWEEQMNEHSGEGPDPLTLAGSATPTGKATLSTLRLPWDLISTQTFSWLGLFSNSAPISNDVEVGTLADSPRLWWASPREQSMRT